DGLARSTGEAAAGLTQVANASDSLATNLNNLSSLTGEQSAMPAAPRMQTTDVDPFARLGQRNVPFETVDMAAAKAPKQPLVATDSVEEALLQSNWTPGKPVEQVALGNNVMNPVEAQLASLAKQPTAETTFGLPTGR